jgi:integrase
MTGIPHVIRRGAIYYWRRRLPPSLPPRCKAGLITLSLKTADSRLARQRAAYLTARSQQPFEKVRRGMLTETEFKAIMRLAAIEIEEVYKKDHLEGLIAGDLPPKDMAGLVFSEHARVESEFNRRRASHAPLSALAGNEKAALLAMGWTEAMVRALDAKLVLAAEFSTFDLEKPGFEAIAKKAGIERYLSEAELYQVHQAVARARAVVMKRFADGADVDTAADEAAIFAMDRGASLLPASTTGQAPQSQPPHPGIPPTPPRVRTPFVIIHELLLKEKQKAQDWTPKTAQQSEFILKLFFDFLSVRQKKSSVEEIEQVDLDDFDAILTGLNPRHGKSAADAELSGMDYVMKYSAPHSDHKDVMAGVTLNRHWGFIEQFFARAKRRGVELNRLDISPFYRKKSKKPRDERATPAAATIRDFFRLPIFTGCRGPELRKEKDGRPMYLPGPHVFHRAAYFAPMIAHYHGFRREEFCGLAINDIETKGRFTIFLIRFNEFRRLKNTASERKHVLHPELVRLGFLDYVERIRKLGYDRIFPDLVAPNPQLVAGERLYDELRPAFSDTDLVTHGFRHFFGSDLKRQSVAEEFRADLLGHAHDSETAGRYADEVWGQKQLDLLMLVENVTDHLEPQPIQLLPWVERRLPPPWHRKQRAGNGGNA